MKSEFSAGINRDCVMLRLKGHFDGSAIVLDETVPAGVVAGREVEVVFVEPRVESGGDCRSFVESIEPLIGSIDGPRDLSEEHDHYAHGAPKRADRNG